MFTSSLVDTGLLTNILVGLCVCLLISGTIGDGFVFTCCGKTSKILVHVTIPIAYTSDVAKGRATMPWTP